MRIQIEAVSSAIPLWHINFNLRETPCRLRNTIEFNLTHHSIMLIYSSLNLLIIIHELL